MSDLDRLRTAFDSGTLLRPSPDILNIVDLSRALAVLGGVEGVTETDGSKNLEREITPSEHLVFVLADGLGMDLLETLPRDNFLRRHLVTELRTVFPSSTAVALTSLATGEWPSRHAITGWWTHLAEIAGTATILPFVARSNGTRLDKLGVTIPQAFPIAPLIAGTGCEAALLFPDPIFGSVYSTYLSAGRPRKSFRGLPEAVDMVVATVEDARGPTFTQVYWPGVDSDAHVYGLARPEVHRAIRQLSEAVEALVRRLGGRGTVVVCADHGHLEAPVARRHRLKPADVLPYLRYSPSGDARIQYFHTVNGQSDALREHLESRLGEGFLLLTADEAVAEGLFGPPPASNAMIERIGDLIAISAGRDVVEYVPSGRAANMLRQSSYHSGLTPGEMRVPLIVA